MFDNMALVKRFTALLAVCSLVACSAKAPEGPKAGEVKNPDTYTYLSIGDIDSLDPAWAYDTASHEQILQMYEPLLAYKPGSLSEFEPAVASKVPSRANGLISKDHRTYRFPIRKGIKFHDGTVLTPADVKFSIMRFCLYDRDGGPSAILLEPLTGYSVTRKDGKPDPAVYQALEKALKIDGDELVITLKEPFAPFLTIVAQWGVVLSKDFTAAHGGWDGSEATWAKFNNPKKQDSYYQEHENGTGPFKLERWSRDTNEMVQIRFDGYWRGPAKLKRYVTKAVDEFATRKLMLAAGDADAIYAQRMQFPDVSSIPGVTIIDDLPTVEVNPAVFFTFKVETAANPDIGSGKLDGAGIPADFFSDLDVRKAFAYSLDYDGYIRDILRGKGTQSHGCIPKVLLGFDPGIPVYHFDPKKAEEHLKKAWGGQAWEKGFRFTLSYNAGNEVRQVVAQMLKRNIEALNPKFKIDTRGIQWSTYLDAFTAHKLPVFVMAWQADYPDPHNFAHPFLYSKGQWGAIQRFSDPQIDQWIDKARVELDPAKRKALYVQMQKRAYELVPQAYLADNQLFRTQRDWVQGYVHDPVWPDHPYSTYMWRIWKGLPNQAPGASR
jgi:peptide/nickel transport system substrate-binding protein